MAREGVAVAPRTDPRTGPSAARPCRSQARRSGLAERGEPVAQPFGLRRDEPGDARVARRRRRVQLHAREAEAALHRARGHLDELHPPVRDDRLAPPQHPAREKQVVGALAVAPRVPVPREQHPAAGEHGERQQREERPHRSREPAHEPGDEDGERDGAEGEEQTAEGEDLTGETEPGGVGGGCARGSAGGWGSAGAGGSFTVAGRTAGRGRGAGGARAGPRSHAVAPVRTAASARAAAVRYAVVRARARPRLHPSSVGARD
ncbi:putative integral membrane protein [Streptomyces sp. Tu6071]|nr:putative integral membrane protein [Streptomyces sp. Tu6071]